jgi:hypothetical protein
LLRGLDSGLDGIADGSRGVLELIFTLDNEFCSLKLLFLRTVIKTMDICDGDIMSSITGSEWLPSMTLALECVGVDFLGLATTLEMNSEHKLILNILEIIVQK